MQVAAPKTWVCAHPEHDAARLFLAQHHKAVDEGLHPFQVGGDHPAGGFLINSLKGVAALEEEIEGGGHAALLSLVLRRRSRSAKTGGMIWPSERSADRLRAPRGARGGGSGSPELPPPALRDVLAVDRLEPVNELVGPLRLSLPR
ncbi:MAG: hypothetical protein ACRDLL_16610 [Solirubrobacterales bacterium]